MLDLKYFVGYNFMLQWCFQNTGEDWPSKQVIFKQIAGDDFKFVPFKIEKTIPRGKTLDMFVNMQAPLVPGKYQGFFRLCQGKNEIEFGEKVWINCTVEAKNVSLSEIINPNLQGPKMVDQNPNEEKKVESIQDNAEEEIIVSLENQLALNEDSKVARIKVKSSMLFGELISQCKELLEKYRGIDPKHVHFQLSQNVLPPSNMKLKDLIEKHGIEGNLLTVKFSLSDPKIEEPEQQEEINFSKPLPAEDKDEDLDDLEYRPNVDFD